MEGGVVFANVFVGEAGVLFCTINGTIVVEVPSVFEWFFSGDGDSVLNYKRSRAR